MFSLRKQVEGRGRAGRRGAPQQAVWSSHCILHRGCTGKTGPPAPGGDVHGIEDFFSKKAEPQIFCGARQVINRSINFFKLEGNRLSTAILPHWFSSLDRFAY